MATDVRKRKEEATAKSSTAPSANNNSSVEWNGYSESKYSFLGYLGIMICCPLLSAWLRSVHSWPTVYNILMWIFFMVLQLVLYVVVPGTWCYGPLNNDGRSPIYKLNAFRTLLISAVIYSLPGFRTWMADAEADVIVIGTAFSYVASLYFLLRGYLNRLPGRGNVISDFYQGLEFAPSFELSEKDRLAALEAVISKPDNIPASYNWKEFIVGHLGMTFWLLIPMGSLWRTPAASTFLAFFYAAVYVLDWAWYEQWYTNTLDMTHDRCGFYFLFGCLGWIPAAYVIHCSYVEHDPYHNPTWQLVLSAILFVIGYSGFRLTNNEKDHARATGFTIFGRKAEFVNCTYQTANGTHQSRLLKSGFWGLARHFNYTCDLVICLAISVLVGTRCWMGHLFPVFMVVLLLVRERRDDQRCSLKYGDSWKAYCKEVPYRFIPYVY